MRGKSPSSRAANILEVVLQRKLGFAPYATGSVDKPELAVVVVIRLETRIGLTTVPEIRVVEQVEELRPELDVCVFRSPELLEDREVQIVKAWIVDLVPRSTQR